ALKSNYVNPDALNQTELDRATFEGALTRLGRGATLLGDANADAGEAPAPFYSDIVLGHVGYLRLGDLSRPNLEAMDASLQTFAAKKVDAVVVDLRAGGTNNDFETAADFVKRFCPKTKPLFSLRKRGARQERNFTNDRDPAYQGLMIVLADGDTSGPAEAVAGVLRLYDKALLIGSPTAGRAVELSDLKLTNGKILRVAVGEAVLPEDRPLFPGGLKPDLPVEMSPIEKREVFQQSRDKGIGPFVFETERPHLNEAALLSGRNPELEAAEAAQRRGRAGEKPALRDPVLQRALDVVTSIGIYQRR
ncbi:MAG: S41 family peptidase, partial [Verrucomicrobiota bacterium]|nr:S41 family peptidase [Verrucomicrobiota bacterium]